MISNQVSCDQDYNPSGEKIKYADIDDYTNRLFRDIGLDSYRSDVNTSADDMLSEPAMPLALLATEFDAEPESNNTTYYGIGAAAFTTIAAAAYLYRKRQEAKGMTDEFQRV